MKPTPEEERELFELASAFVDLLPAYRDRAVAFQNYARYVAEKYCGVDGTATCDRCGPRVGVLPHVVTWRGDFDTRRTQVKNLLSLPLMLTGHVLLHHESVRFVTHHRFCPACRRHLRWRGYASDFVRIGFSVATVIFAIAMVISFIITLLPFSSDPWARWRTGAWCAAFLAGLIYVFRASRRTGALFLPSPLAEIAKKFFFIESIRVQR